MSERETMRMEEVRLGLAEMAQLGYEVPSDALPATSTGAHPDLAAHELMGLADAGHSHAGYAASSHGHAETDVTSLATDLAGKASSGHNHDLSYSAAGHGHAEGDVTGLSADLAGKASAAHNHDASYSGVAHNHDGVYAPYGQVGGSFQFPVDYLYISFDATNPATVLGYGTWALITSGLFLVSADPASELAGATVGAATHGHAFTPPADHSALAHSGTGVADHSAGTSGTNSGAAIKPGTSGSATGAPTGHTHSTPALVHSVTDPAAHAAQAHTGAAVADGSNIPPGIKVFAWRRTA